MEGNIKTLGSYPLESLQIFFPASLEIQEELLKAGFRVPYDKESKIETPIPVVCAFNREMKIQKKRLLLANKFEEDGDFCVLPKEEAFLNMSVYNDKYLSLAFALSAYHLERLTFTSVPPRLWRSWVTFYLNFENFEDLIGKLEKFIEKSLELPIAAENKKNGKEIAIYAYKGRFYRDLGIPVLSYNLNLGSLKLAKEYFRQKAKENGIKEDVLRFLKLGLRKEKRTKAGLRIGLTWKNGKPSRIFLKLTSDSPKIKINGLYGELVGKSRGTLSNIEKQEIVVRVDEFYSALLSVRNAFGS